MLRVCVLAIAAGAVLLGCNTTGAKKPSTKPNGAVAAAFGMTPKHYRMMNLVDNPSVPEELRTWMMLTMDLNLRDLFGDSGVHKGRKISDVISRMVDNLKIAGELSTSYRSALKVSLINGPLMEIKESLASPYHNTHYWRELYTFDLEHRYPGGAVEPNNITLFANFRALSGTVQVPFLELAQKVNPDPNTGKRQAVEDALNTEITLGTPVLYWAGHLTYVDLFTLGHDDVAPEVEEAVNKLLNKPNPPILRSRDDTFGVDCCCPNASPDGFKKCGPSPELGCSETGTPKRCTLGSIYCPANCVY